MIKLTYTVTTAPDLSGFIFYVEEGRIFDADDYADAYHLNRHDMDAEDVHNAQDASARLMAGEWLLVTHESIDE